MQLIELTKIEVFLMPTLQKTLNKSYSFFFLSIFYFNWLSLFNLLLACLDWETSAQITRAETFPCVHGSMSQLEIIWHCMLLIFRVSTLCLLNHFSCKIYILSHINLSRSHAFVTLSFSFKHFCAMQHSLILSSVYCSLSLLHFPCAWS